MWASDSGSSGGSTAETGSPIAGTSDDPLYQSERYGDFGYQFPVPNGPYTVTLKFAEFYWNSAGQRVFDVLLEGQPVLSNFDILAQVAPNTALDRTFTITVSDGALTVQFVTRVDNAKLSALEVVTGTSSTPTPTLSATATSTGVAPSPTATRTPTRTATQPPTATGTGASPSPTPSASPTRTPTPPVSFQPIRVNAGGAAYTDGQGRVWASDSGSSGGSTAETGSPIAGTSDDPLYQSERYGDFSYQFPVPNGPYTVNLKFAEFYWSSPGQRVFDVLIEGQPVLGNFDILAQVGPNTALDKSFTTTVSDGSLTVEFRTQVDNAKLSAIEIRAGTSATPSISPTLTTSPTPTPTGVATSPTATPSATLTRTPTRTATPSGSFQPIRVVAGGAAYTDGAGQLWAADGGFTGGSTASTGSAIANTADDPLYQSERYGDFGYQFPVPNGPYTVTLKFAEFYWNSAGQRVFDVLLEGQPVLSNFDILAQVAPNTALDRTFTITVSDGALTVQFVTRVDNAKLSALEVLAGDTAPPTVISTVPSAGASGVAVDSDVTATFSGPMNPATISTSSFTLVNVSTGATVAAVVSYDAPSLTARLRPNTGLLAGTTYRVTVKGGPTGVKSQAGTPMVADHVTTFTTAASAGSPAMPVIWNPSTDGQIAHPADPHFETAPFSSPNPSDTHYCTDWEVRVAATLELVWSSPCNTVVKVHAHMGNGTFVNSYAGRTEFMYDTDYLLRVRFRGNSSDPLNQWSPWAERRFRTSPQPAPGGPVAWTARQAGYQVEVVAGGFQLPVNIAFRPNPGPLPSDPLFYVAELYGNIKVVRRDGTVTDYVRGVMNFRPSGVFPGDGEMGLAGLVVDPASGDLFASMLYDPDSILGEPYYGKVVRFHSDPTGTSATSFQTILDMFGEPQSASHQISNLSIGPDGKLYVHNGDGFDTSTPQNINVFRGKVLRMNLNGTPAVDNPFYDPSDGITAKDYVYASGFRNPFGGSWRATDNAHYIVENGPSVDRMSKLVRGRNYLFDGTDASMRNYAIYNWAPAVAPVNIAFIEQGRFNGSGFPTSKLDHAFVAESGPTYATGPVTNGKRISEFVLDGSGNLVSGPTPLIEYTGTGKATAAGLAAGPDGLYFTDLYKDLNSTSPVDDGAQVLRVRYVGTGGPSSAAASGMGTPTGTGAAAAQGTFSLTAAPETQGVTRGGSATYTITIAGSGGFSGNVSLDASGLPPGAVASFTPNPASVGTSGSSSSIFTVRTSSSTPVGTFTLRVNAVSGGSSQATAVSLGVR